MAFFRKLFGRETPSELEAEAEALFDNGEFGLAKLRFEYALEKMKNAPAGDRERVAARVAASRDAIADLRLVEGERQLTHGHPEHAEQEVRGALEIAVDPVIIERAKELLLRVEAYEDYAEEEDPTEISDEDRLALIMAAWPDAKAIEYEELGDEAFDAALELHKGHFVRARERFEMLLTRSTAPVYLHRDLGLARLHVDDLEGAEASFRAFLATAPDGTPGRVLLETRVDLVRLLDGRGDFEGAMAELEAALDSAGDDYGPLLVLGHYLRTRGHAPEAIEVLRAAQALLGERRDYALVEEMGLALLAAGREEEGEALLEEVFTSFTAGGKVDVPPGTGVALAQLYEKRGRLERAAGIYRLLSLGSDVERRPAYASEAARVLVACGLVDEAKRMLRQASALVASDPEAKAEIDKRLAELT